MSYLISIFLYVLGFIQDFFIFGTTVLQEPWHFPPLLCLIMERHHLEPEVRNIIEKISGQGYWQVGITDAVDVSQSVVSQALARFIETTHRKYQ